MSTPIASVSNIRVGRPRKGEEVQRRCQLLDAAARLFAEVGYGNLSLETIAREARVSLRTIYRQFGGKAELFGAVVRHYSDLIVAGLPRDLPEQCDPEEVLVSFARDYLFQLTRPRLLRLRAQFLAEAHRFPALAAECYAVGPERTVASLAEIFARLQRMGKIAELEPRFLAGQFVTGLRGERFQRLELGLEEPPGEDDIDLWARRAVAVFLRGALAPCEPSASCGSVHGTPARDRFQTG